MNYTYPNRTNCGYNNQYVDTPLNRPHSANYNISRSHKILQTPVSSWDQPNSRYCRSGSVSPPGTPPMCGFGHSWGTPPGTSPNCGFSHGWGTPPTSSPCGWNSYPAWGTPPGTSCSPIGGFSNTWGTPPGTLSSPMSGNSGAWGSPPGTLSSPISGHSYLYGSPPGTLASPICGIPFPPGYQQQSLSPHTLSALLQIASNSRFSSNGDLANGANDNSNTHNGNRNVNGPASNNGQTYAEPNIIDHFGPVTRGGFEKVSPPPPVVQKVRTPAPSPLRSPRRFCEIHQKLPPFWCQTCSLVFCNECSTNIHRHHVTLLLVEVLEGAGTRATQVLSDANAGIDLLREDLVAVQNAVELLDQKAQEAATEVMVSIDRVISGLEARQQELLKKIEDARISKFTSLRVRDESLRNGIVRITHTIEKLSGVLEASVNATNPLELLMTKDMASAEIFQVIRNRHPLPPSEESWISFAGLDATAANTISNFGSIMLTNPGPIGDRRGLKGRPPTPDNSIDKSGEIVQRSPAPCGRPISLNGFPVTVNELMSKPRPVATIGNTSEPRDNLCRPWGVTCDKDGHIIVADRSNNRIQIYNEGGTLIRQFGSLGSAPGQFDRPAGITVDCRKRIVVADKDNHRIQILTMDGRFLQAFGEKGCRNGQFNYPWDVATNAECQIVVSDTRNHRIQLFSAEGVFLRKYGYETTPSMWKYFDSPRGVAFNPQGNVVTTDFNNHRVIVINANFMSAKVLDCDKGGEKQFQRPQGVIVDDVGNIVVSDSRNHRIQIFNPEGSLQWKFGTCGNGPEEMDRPSGIAITPTGRIAVIDFGNNRLMLI